MRPSGGNGERPPSAVKGRLAEEAARNMGQVAPGLAGLDYSESYLNINSSVTRCFLKMSLILEKG